MRYFYWDASALAKRYAPEIGTPLVNALFSLFLTPSTPFRTMRTDERKGRVKTLRTARKVHAGEQGATPRRRMHLRVSPTEAALNRLSRRLQEALAESGISPEQALKNLEQVRRRRRFQRLYGKR